MPSPVKPDKETADQVMKRVVILGDDPEHDAMIDHAFDMLDERLNGPNAIRTVYLDNTLHL
jgi:hypothetical protein